jgi:uncharacterized cupredoxin-like copper-binding protein
MAVLGAIILLSGVACQRDAGVDYAREANPPKATTTAVSPPVEPAQPAGTVELTEYSIRMPQTLKAGKHVLTIVNAGKERHSIEIEGNGLEAGLSAPLSRGDQTRWEVTLTPGTYEVYCPVNDHQEKGMTTRLVVQ